MLKKSVSFLSKTPIFLQSVQYNQILFLFYLPCIYLNQSRQSIEFNPKGAYFQAVLDRSIPVPLPLIPPATTIPLSLRTQFAIQLPFFPLSLLIPTLSPCRLRILPPSHYFIHCRSSSSLEPNHQSISVQSLSAAIISIFIDFLIPFQFSVSSFRLRDYFSFAQPSPFSLVSFFQKALLSSKKKRRGI